VSEPACVWLNKIELPWSPTKIRKSILILSTATCDQSRPYLHAPMCGIYKLQHRERHQSTSPSPRLPINASCILVFFSISSDNHLDRSATWYPSRIGHDRHCSKHRTSKFTLNKLNCKSLSNSTNIRSIQTRIHKLIHYKIVRYVNYKQERAQDWETLITGLEDWFHYPG